jgi:hypothetical protein
LYLNSLLESGGQFDFKKMRTLVTENNWRILEEKLGLLPLSTQSREFDSERELEEARGDGEGLLYTNGLGEEEGRSSVLFRVSL